MCDIDDAGTSGVDGEHWWASSHICHDNLRSRLAHIDAPPRLSMFRDPPFVRMLGLCPFEEFLYGQKLVMLELFQISWQRDHSTKALYIINSSACVDDVSRIGNRRDQKFFR
ncbi:hypothetical protein ASF04_03075 [Duganella sp. Leaf61]|nr:hypothetical protein ASF04_03075 [Duganella sp. Leaf61]